MEPPSSPPAAPEEVTLVEKLLMGLGILLGLCGSIMINVGNNVQALGMGLDAAQQDLDVKERSKRPKVLWITGTVTFIVGSVINFVAFVFAAASVLAPLEAIQFVSNLVFARFVTKVPVSRRMVAGSALIVAGTVGAVAGGPMTVTSFTIPQLRGFWESPAWIAYVAFAWITSLSMQTFWEVQSRRNKIIQSMLHTQFVAFAVKQNNPVYKAFMSTDARNRFVRQRPRMDLPFYLAHGENETDVTYEEIDGRRTGQDDQVPAAALAALNMNSHRQGQGADDGFLRQH